MWIGVLFNIVAIALTGASALLESNTAPPSAHIASNERNSVFGVILILLGAFMQSMQYVAEEALMSSDWDMPAAPPMLLIGMEGLWGTIICIFVVYPIAYALPGDDHGSFENFFNTLVMVENSTEIQFMVIVYSVAIFVYNVMGCLVTYLLSAVWHAILDNFRPVTIWGADLGIYYLPLLLAGVFPTDSLLAASGEKWTVWSWLQLSGMCVLFCGTAM